MKYPTYPKLKSSGISWLGDVPEHWEMKKLKGLATFSGGGTPSRDIAAYWNGDIPWVSPKDMKAERINGTEESITKEGLQGSASNLLAPGRVLLVVRSGILKHTIPIAINEIAVALNQDMKALSFDESKCSSHFFFRWVQGLNDQLLFAWSKQGATVESIEHSYFAQTVIPLPPLSEQIAIVAFLGREIAKIDALVAKKRQLIAALQAERTALISQTVTRGLPSQVAREAGLPENPPLKPSGIEWLGDVPEHWEIQAIKRKTLVKRGASPRPIDDPIYFEEDGEYSWVRISDVTTAGAYLYQTEQRMSKLGSSLSVKLEPGSLFLSIAGTVGKPCIAAVRCCIHDGFVYFPTWRDSTKYLLYIFLSTQPYKGLGKMGTQLNLNTETVGLIKIGIPPLSEQIAIAAFLDRETTKIDALVAKVEAAIEKLQQYRTALISSAVTGKIDVRSAA